MNSDKLGQAALAYTERFGWAVFPLHTLLPNGGCSCGNPDCGKNTGKHPRIIAWQNEATSDAEVIRRWWGRWPGANIGLATGKSGLVVIDLDTKNGVNGLETWADLEAELNFHVDTVVNLTPNGGQHLLFAAPADVDISPSTGKMGPGVDVRAGNSYIVLPPSQVGNNKPPYIWELSSRPGECPIVPLPEPLLKLLTNSKPEAAPPLPDMIPVGERDDTLTSLAGTLRRRNTSEEAIFAALWVENQRCEIPLPEKDVRRIAHSVMRYPPGQQRKHTQKLGAKIPTDRAGAIRAIAPKPPDPELKAHIIAILLATDQEEKPPMLLRRQEAGQLLLAWLQDSGGFVQSEAGEFYYFSHTERRLYPLETDRWRAWLYALTGANPAGTDFAYLSADCKAAAIAAPQRPVLKVAAWDDHAQVLRVSRFDGTVYVLDGENISEEPNGQNVIFVDDPLWLPYKPDFSAPGALRWSTSELPNFDGDGDALGLAFRAWVVILFLSELCPTRPLLVFIGEKGSGKSMVLRVLLRLLFGPVGQLSGVPDKPDGFTAAAASVHVLVLDNLDNFTGWLRDKLARLSTGATDEYRKLYTSNEVGHVVYRCWLAFTARTPDTLKRDDLADRLLLLPVQRIEEDARQPERDFLAQTIAVRNAWWGDLLTTLNQVVARIRDGELASTSRLRMADWESLARLVARSEGREETWDGFVDNLERGQCDFLLEGELVIDALDLWLQDESNHGREVTTRELYEEWTATLFGEKKLPADWPKSVKSLGRRLASIRRNLQTLYRVEWSKPRANKLVYCFWPLEIE